MSAEDLNRLINVLAAVTLFEMMAAIGLGVKATQVLAVARDWRMLARAALANYVCVPAAALGLLLLFRPHAGDPAAFRFVAAGFLIAAVCPGAPYGPPFTGIAGGNTVLSVGLMVLLAASSAIVAPLLLFLLLPITSGASTPDIPVLKIIGVLLVAQMLPLSLGLALGQWRSALAEKLKKPARLLSALLNIILLGLIFAAQFNILLEIPLRAFLGMVALVSLSLAAGWLLGGKQAADRTALAMATAVRNVGVALVIATASFGGTMAVTAATAFALFQTVVMALTAFLWGKVGRRLQDHGQRNVSDDETRPLSPAGMSSRCDTAGEVAPTRTGRDFPTEIR